MLQWRLRAQLGWQRLAVAVCITGAVPAAAFNLGQIEVRSHLGQPFDAVVPFAATPGESVDAACFALAPRNPSDGFAALPPVTIEVTTTKNGGQAHIRTRQPVREPVITLALRAGCAGGGELRRDFTVTLDPPPQAPR